MVTSLLANISTRTKVNILFGKSIKISQKSLQQVLSQVYFILNREINGSL